MREMRLYVSVKFVKCRQEEKRGRCVEGVIEEVDLEERRKGKKGEEGRGMAIMACK
jgi:hypothetical protein